MCAGLCLIDTSESLEAHVAITVVDFRIRVVMIYLTLYSDMIKVSFVTCMKPWCEPYTSNFYLGFLYSMYVLVKVSKSDCTCSKPSTEHIFLPLSDSYQG